MVMGRAGWAGGRTGERMISFSVPSSDTLSGCFTPTAWLGQRGLSVGTVGRSTKDSGPRGCPGPGHCRIKVSAPPLRPLQAGQAGAHPPRPALGARGCPLHNPCWGNAARAVPTGSQIRVGPSSWRGHQNHTRQNINYCCFQSPTTGGCLALPRKSK